MSWLSSLFQSKKDPNADALSSIRSQLQSLASGVPALVEKQKSNIRSIYDTARTEGRKSIGEDVYATRGLGRTSIYDRLYNELLDKTAQSQAEAELNAEMGGLSTQSKLLGSAAGINVPEEQPSPFSSLLGVGANLLGQELGYSRLKDVLNENKPITSYEDNSYLETPEWLKNLQLIPGSTIS